MNCPSCSRIVPTVLWRKWWRVGTCCSSCVNAVQHRSIGRELWPVISNGDKDSEIVVEIVNMCDSEGIMENIS